LSPPPRDTRAKVQTDDPSPPAQELRLLLNGLAGSELRQMFCALSAAAGSGSGSPKFATPATWNSILSSPWWKSGSGLRQLLVERSHVHVALG
jgi:hypothetical protein